MIGYRLFFFNRIGGISHACELECTDEAAAREAVLSRFSSFHTELWHLNRKVAVLPAKRLGAHIPNGELGHPY